MSPKEYQLKMKKIQNKKQQREMKRKLRKESLSWLPKIKLPSTSKMVLWSLILLNIQIIAFVEKAMLQWGDFSAAYALIGIPATLIPIVWGYYSKSKAENTAGGIIYDMAMKNEVDTVSDDEALG